MESWADVPVLVTGAAGYIGRHLCARLRASGARVTALVRRSEQAAGLPHGIHVEPVDVTDAAQVRACFERARPERVFHLAGLVTPDLGLEALPAHVQANTLGTASVLAAAVVTQPRKLVVTGTVAECGPSPPAPVLDNTPADPRTPYGISKALATRMCVDAWKASGLPVTVVRLFQVYGSHMPARYFLRQLVDATLAGQTLDMTDGRQTRDFTHVDDVVEGLLAAAACVALDGRVANLCTGVERSLREVCERWERITGHAGGVRLGMLAHRAHEVFRCFGEPRALCELTAWRPRISLEDGLRDLWSRATSP